MNLILAIMTTMTINSTIVVKSPDFRDNGYIPVKYSCDGSNVNPALVFENLPKEAKTLALILDDPDAGGRTFVHWVMWNIPPDKGISEGSSPGVQGKNGKKENKYTGPCPPSGTHHYHFKVYALDTKLDLPENTNKDALLNAMNGHIIATGELIGLFKR